MWILLFLVGTAILFLLMDSLAFAPFVGYLCDHFAHSRHRGQSPNEINLKDRNTAGISYVFKMMEALERSG